MHAGIEGGGGVCEEESSVVESKEMRCVPVPVPVPVPIDRNYRVCEMIETPKAVKYSSSEQLSDIDQGKSTIRSNSFPVTAPRYLTLEPSLAMDWLEIAWDDLHIKERIGAGNHSPLTITLITTPNSKSFILYTITT